MYRIYGFLGIICLALVCFIFSSTYHHAQLPKNKAAVGTIINIIVEDLSSNKNFEVISISKGSQVKGGGWGQTIKFKSFVDKETTINTILSIINKHDSKATVNKRPKNDEVSCHIYLPGLNITIYNNIDMGVEWEIIIISNR